MTSQPRIAGWCEAAVVALLTCVLSGCPQPGTAPVDGDAGADGEVDADCTANGAAAAPGWFAAGACECGPDDWFTVNWVADGDTLQLTTGDSVRFLGINTPETTSKQCRAEQAKAFTLANAGKGTELCLTTDAKAGDRDHYKRLLRYVWIRKDGVPVLLIARLVRLGLARVYYPFASGLRLESALKAAQAAATDEVVGGWKTCGW